MLKNLRNAMAYGLAAALLGACKVSIEVTGGGTVSTESGVITCDAGLSPCKIDVSDTNFDETFHALPDDRYIFAHWRKGKGYFCGYVKEECRLTTVAMEGKPEFESFLTSDDEFYLAPLFLEVMSFAEPVTTGPGPSFEDSRAPWETIAIDWDQDGDLDLVIYHSILPTEDLRMPMMFFQNDGTGNFTDVSSSLYPSQIPSTVWARKNLIADYNGDGLDDVFVIDHGMDAAPTPMTKNSLFLGSGTKLIQSSGRLPDIIDFSHAGTYGDIDMDGDLDIVVGNYGVGPDTYFLINDGYANFSESSASNHMGDYNGRNNYDPALPLSAEWTANLLFDADGDGDPDLIGAGHVPSDGDFHLWKNDGTGNFSIDTTAIPQQPFVQGDALMQGIEAVDIDGDDDLDLLVVSTGLDYSGALLFVLINNGAGRFANESRKRINIQPQTEQWIRNIVPMDVDGDGDIDFFLEGEWDANALYLNAGEGRFYKNPEISQYQDPLGNTVEYSQTEYADFNGDGVIDLLSVQAEFQIHFAEGSGPRADHPQ